MKAYRKHTLLGALVLVAVLCCSLAFAQEGTAALNGRITDHDSLPVAGVKVQALNAGTNVSYLANTNDTGLYNFPTLPAGTYNVTATKEGFQQAVRPGVELHVSDVISLNFSLQVGSMSQSVTVEGGAPLVETTSSEIGGLVNGKEIEDLPLNGRNYIDLSLLQAGVTNSLNSTGTNGFGGMTGTVYSSNLRNSAINARNFFDGTKIPQLEKNNFGASLGGPIRKDKTFFYAVYCQHRDSREPKSSVCGEPGLESLIGGEAARTL